MSLMKFAICDADGLVTQTGHIPSGSPELLEIMGARSCPDEIEDGSWFWTGKEFKPITKTKPSPGHSWDSKKEQWTDRRASGDRARQHENFLAQIRAERDAKLAACDWTQMPDVSMTEEKKEAWKIYRQALREITDKLPKCMDCHAKARITWPVAP